MGDNPWKRVATKRIYDNAFFEVREDAVIRPDENPGTYGVVTAARWALGIVPLWPNGTVTLVGQYRYPIDEYSWEIPEGGGDLKLDPLVGAKLELLEETGIEAASWTYLRRCHTSNCFVNEVGHLYLAQGLRQGTQPAELRGAEREHRERRGGSDQRDVAGAGDAGGAEAGLLIAMRGDS